MLFDKSPTKHYAIVPRLTALLMLMEVLCIHRIPCRLDIQRFYQAQSRLWNGMTDQLPPAEQHLLCFITFSVCDAEKASNIFRSTAQSILGLTVARKNMVFFSCGLSALQGRKDWEVL